ncbi:hypothetical protein DL766_005602 [Monosporascus sp. MC13-8B]|uniref:Uncharacterized protein n=1 Tax=Monosporascus cannonballus TaxID=155416 RepID=A0ABY0GXK8_9PEZI|nr:hypothetical protein DL762_009400 [Monosporascus cannonballus]RYO79552.1 hypothetical protein DL763_009229 [Monosporascus cannonballus]RYP28988.1 hypothetical protein DL766_005602 [Monosporascus sp. MC13-8B]
MSNGGGFIQYQAPRIRPSTPDITGAPAEAAPPPPPPPSPSNRLLSTTPAAEYSKLSPTIERNDVEGLFDLGHMYATNLRRDTDTLPPQAEAGSQGSGAGADEFGATQSSASTAFHTDGAPFDDSASDSSADGSEVRKPESPQFHRAVALVMGNMNEQLALLTHDAQV